MRSRTMWGALMAIGGAIAVFAALAGIACLFYAGAAGQAEAHPGVVFGWLGGTAGMVLLGLFGVWLAVESSQRLE